jgi:hypothetical protein
MSANDDDAWLLTLGLIGLFRSGVTMIVSLLREVGEDPDIATAIALERFERRGKLRGFITYRVHGDHIVAMVEKIRIEFNTAHPEGFSAYLLQRHIDLNRKLKRFYPQYVNLPLVKGLEQLVKRGLIRTIDAAASLLTLTQVGLERATVDLETLWQEIKAGGDPCRLFPGPS